ncbi:beta-1,4-galactosyltransferase 7-like isoform X2 [Oscarella lobularis]|uniref:beta-1,4-galactosyltransferase 7-like isoform X2 n=1 Tax=Oscarella lobularis TaxID=121494 RepID=UPI003313C179
MFAKKTVLFVFLYASTVMFGVTFWMSGFLMTDRDGRVVQSPLPCVQNEAKSKKRVDTPPPPPRYKDEHQLAVVVPIRDRFEEFLEFVPHIHRFLNQQKIRHQIWVINQFDKHRFNRASLINVGFLLSTRRGCDYMAMHDVDLLPLNPALDYSYPKNGPFHVAAPDLHPKYHYKTFVGGILILTAEQFEKCNGLSNLFWGWGREDDEFYRRMIEAGYTVQSPKNITTGYQTFKHVHDESRRTRDKERLFNQREVSRTRDRVTGLHDVDYQVIDIVNVTIKEAPCTLVNVKLACDNEKTPFCDKPEK